MCGIAGYIGKVSNPNECLNSMVHAINHRGPDNRGIWLNQSNSVGFAHARLSILDLSSAGHQPMHSSCNNLVMIFNGEIYNHVEIRSELEKIQKRDWQGHSDTETLLAAIEHWGLDTTLKKSKGMFALAIWDKKKKILSLVSDRMGEKPIYYGWINGQFVFASELKALKKFPNFSNQIDQDALTLFLRFNSIPSPYSIYKDIYKLEQGQVIQFHLDSWTINKSNYWSTEEEVIASNLNKLKGSSQRIITKLDEVLTNAVTSQMLSDVPLGAFLSGGIDSSSIVAIMQANSNEKINTFSIGFYDDNYDEAKHAKEIAQYIGTNHHEMYVSEKHALDVIPNLPNIYDEPFADSSQIPTYLLSKFAKEHVTVALSGDAGDELFGGYNRYVFAKNIFSKISKTPVFFKSALSGAIRSISEEKWNRYLNGILGKKYANIGVKLNKVANILNANSISDLQFRLASQIQNPSDWLNYSSDVKTKLDDDIERFQGLDHIEKMLAYDLITYLPTDILTKVDRAAMSVSLETRLPFLDRDVIRFSSSMPINLKIRNGVTKWALREVLYKYVPKELVNKPKMGFAVPLAAWLRGPLRDWGESMLNEKRLSQEGYFDVEFVRNKWLKHLSCKENHEHQLWNVLMFQAWLERN